MTTAISPAFPHRAFLSTEREPREVRPDPACSILLHREQIEGSLSLIGTGAVPVQALPGLVVRARSGTVLIRRVGNGAETALTAGARFVAARAEAIQLIATGRCELHLEWPDCDLRAVPEGADFEIRGHA